MKKWRLLAAAGLAALGIAGGASATTYISDPNLSDFASTSTDFATLSNYNEWTFGTPHPTEHTTLAILQTGDRVYDGGMLPGLPGSQWIEATFDNATSSIRVFANIDHETTGPDAYEYSIEGSNDGKTWTPLFNATGTSAGAPFTLTSFTGTAPTQVDATLTGACAISADDCVGYIADFTFAKAYKFYAFGDSAIGFKVGEREEELSGVSAQSGVTRGAVPEPASWAMLLGGLGLVGATLRSSRRKTSLTTA